MVAVRFSSLGDVALTTGVLLNWHQAHGTLFTVVTRHIFEPLFTDNPAVQEVIGLEDNELHGQGQAMVFRAIAQKYKDSPLLDLHRSFRSAMLARIWQDAILGYRKMSLERRIFLWSRGRLCGDKLRALNVPQRYASALYDLDAIPPAEKLRPRLFVSEQEQAWASSQLAQLCGERPIVALHPFATYSAKTWPLETWLRFSRLLAENGIPFFWIGRGEKLPDSENTRSFVNTTDLRQLCALLKQASVLITGDSGPMHIATGVDTPVLALFGPTCREWGFFPSGPRDLVLQPEPPAPPCSLHGNGTCPAEASLERITPERVLNALRKLLRNSG